MQQGVAFKQVIIKSPTDSDSLNLTARLEWTVDFLKATIMRLHKFQPPPSSQKLIFGGKVLRDSETLADIFQSLQQPNEPATIHMVLSPNFQPSVSSSSPSFSSTKAPTVTSTSPSQTLYTPSLVNVTPVQCVMVNGTVYMVVPLPSSSTTHHHMVSTALPTVASSQVLPHHNEALAVHAAAPVAANLAPAAQPAAAVPAAAVAPPAVQPAARPAGDNPEAAEPLSFAMAVWLLVRLCFIVYIFTRGGDWTRTTIICICAAIFYLFQIGVRLPRPQRRPRAQRNTPPIPQQQQQQQQQQPAQQPLNGEQQPQQQQQQQQQNGVKGIIALVIPFFTSLLPTQDFAQVAADPMEQAEMNAAM